MAKMSKTRNQDRISVLPDHILFHILSFLDMKQVVKTSVLSKRWQFVWTFLPTLRFVYFGSEEKTSKFFSWVHKTLLRCRNTNIEHLELRVSYSDCFSSDVDCLARFASDKEVRKLLLLLYGTATPSYSLTQSVYCNKFLTSLYISNCKLVPKLGLSWTCLEHLLMFGVELNDDTIEKILSGSPNLDLLVISNCWGFKRLDIKSESLQVLCIENLSAITNGILLQISAPKLRLLKILGCKFGIRCQMLRVLSHLIAEVNFEFQFKDSVTEYKKQYNYLVELIECFHQVHELKLSGHCILPLLASAFGERVEDYWESKRWMEKFPLSHLKTVIFHDFKRLGDVGEFALTLIQFLLENAELLEGIILRVGQKDYHMLTKPRNV